MISPHLDDAVLACGECIATHPGCTVVTVFAGVPADAARRTEWDHRCGFDDAAQAVQVRRSEDRRALSLLEAQPCWLDFIDSQYDEPVGEAAIAEALAAVVRQRAPTTVLLPLGLFHADHRQVHRAARRALARSPAVETIAYEDVPYRGRAGALQERLSSLLGEGVRLTPVRWPAPASAAAGAKRRAIDAYASQQRAFGRGGLVDATLPERFWRFDGPEADDGRR